MRAECDTCGKSFSQSPKVMQKNLHNFCSRECYNEWRRKNIWGHDGENRK